MDSLRTQLEALYDKTKDSRAVEAFMNKIQEQYLNIQMIISKIAQYFRQVISAIAQGIGNAAKIANKHGSAFVSLQAAAKAIQLGVKIETIMENVVKSLAEVDTFVLQAENMVGIELSKSSENPGNVGNKDFIQSRINEWGKILQDNIVSYIKDGVAKPQVQNLVNSFLHQAGRGLKKELFSGNNNLLRDEKLRKNLQKARENNFTRLTSMHSVFSNKNAKAPEEFMAKNGLVPISGDELLHSKIKIANIDGFTPAELKRWGVGMMFFKTPSGEIVCMPPHTFSDFRNLDALERVNDKLPDRFKLTQNNHTDIGEGSERHRVPILTDKNGNMVKDEHGNPKIIDIPSIGGNKKYCDEQTRLFNDKLKRVREKYPNETDEWHLQKAKAYAQKEHKIQKLRSVALLTASHSLRNDPELQRLVSSCSAPLVGGKDKNGPKASLKFDINNKNKFPKDIDIEKLKTYKKELENIAKKIHEARNKTGDHEWRYERGKWKHRINAGSAGTQGGTENPIVIPFEYAKLFNGFDGSDSGLYKIRIPVAKYRDQSVQDILIHCRNS